MEELSDNTTVSSADSPGNVTGRDAVAFDPPFEALTYQVDSTGCPSPSPGNESIHHIWCVSLLAECNSSAYVEFVQGVYLKSVLHFGAIYPTCILTGVSDSIVHADLTGGPGSMGLH